ncbi:class I SAM-dependent methyltransferase [Lacticaseibacillus yichunensis]|uniref:Class I SAM-dependent methyltransferase n=1 Tax=Lacticaseibacillus yichunensis TaxID=2486015 RepID=A0ABW4CKE1_9LACO|nr:class I SAM-dependent methyltransferase [Lacticaseibacillus yichunensis]
MDKDYPNMAPSPEKLPTTTGNKQPLWQALAQKMPKLAGLRVLVIHAGDGWFCRYAINHGAIEVLGISNDGAAMSEARETASSDRLRYRIMPDGYLKLLSGPFDLIVGTFDLRQDDLHAASHQLSRLLKPSGRLIAAVATPLDPKPADGLQIRELFTSRLAIDQWYQVSDQRLPLKETVQFILSSRTKKTK